MSVEISETEVRLPKGLIKMEYRRQGGVMDVRTDENSAHFLYRSTTAPLVDGKKFDFRRSYSQGNNNRRMFKSCYFSLEAMLLLICLATSLVILPLVLPPLPPPPFMLLLLPICILGLLLILALMPSDIRDVSQKSV